MFDLVTGSQYSLPSIFSDEIPTMSLRLCLIYVQNIFQYCSCSVFSSF
jgi:hypothetical protein